MTIDNPNYAALVEKYSHLLIAWVAWRFGFSVWWKRAAKL